MSQVLKRTPKTGRPVVHQEGDVVVLVGDDKTAVKVGKYILQQPRIIPDSLLVRPKRERPSPRHEVRVRMFHEGTVGNIRGDLSECLDILLDAIRHECKVNIYASGLCDGLYGWPKTMVETPIYLENEQVQPKRVPLSDQWEAFETFVARVGDDK